MRIFAFIPALAAFVTAVACSAVPVDTSCGLRVGCGDVESYIALSTAHPKTVITYVGVIQVLDSNDKSLGYISRNLLKAQTPYDPLIENALVVTFTADWTKTGFSTKLALTATNMNPSYPLLGLIQGYSTTDSNLSPNSPHYLHIGGISAPGTRPDSLPSKIGNSFNDAYSLNRTAESAVWTYDALSRALTPQWINTDGSSPHEDFFMQNPYIFAGGSKDAFIAKHGAATTIKLKFVPA